LPYAWSLFFPSDVLEQEKAKPNSGEGQCKLLSQPKGLQNLFCCITLLVAAYHLAVCRVAKSWAELAELQAGMPVPKLLQFTEQQRGWRQQWDLLWLLLY